LCDEPGSLGRHSIIDIAQSDDVDRRDLEQMKQVRLAVPAATDEANPKRLFADGGECPRLQRYQ
jgi:hypothetical protein